MNYNYIVDEKTIDINFDQTKNTATVQQDNKVIGKINSQQELAKGKTLTIGTDSLFIKLINLSEGFTVMVNNKHVLNSAGHPKKLLKRTHSPLLLGVAVVFFQFINIFFDLYIKKELILDTITFKTIGYISYYVIILILLIVAYLLARKGNWTGPFLGGTIILFNLSLSAVIGLYYNTGFNLFVWIFFFGHVIILISLYSHSSVIRYVREYSKG